MRFADLDAVTIDAFGTLVELDDPTAELQELLRARGIERDREQVADAFRTEGRYYRSRAFEGRDKDSLRRLQVDCAGVFLDALGADVPAQEFAPAYIGALRFQAFDGVGEALASLRARGLELAVVGNWDVSMLDWLQKLGLASFFSLMLPVARKPSPERLLEALTQLGVSPERALHVGDEQADEEAAAEAGMHFHPTPLADAVAALE